MKTNHTKFQVLYGGFNYSILTIKLEEALAKPRCFLFTKCVDQINALKYTTSIKLSRTDCKGNYGTLQYDYGEEKCV
jgi:hypothetical protein